MTSTINLVDVITEAKKITGLTSLSTRGLIRVSSEYEPVNNAFLVWIPTLKLWAAWHMPPNKLTRIYGGIQ